MLGLRKSTVRYPVMLELMPPQELNLVEMAVAESIVG